MSRPQSESFGFKNVKHLRRVNFAPDGSLLTKQRVLHNIPEYANHLSDVEKKKQIEYQKGLKDFTHGFTTIMCYAGWCGHCKNMKPIYDNICSASKCMNVQLAAIDCANDNEGLIDALDKSLSKRLNGKKLVAGYPTFIQFKDGVYYRHLGDDVERTPENLLKFILGI